MKLKNKKTGEIATLTLSSDGETFILMNERMYIHTVKLKDLEGWEDAPEEPKSNIGDLPAFPPASLTKEQAVKLAQIAKETREKYEKNKKDG